MKNLAGWRTLAFSMLVAILGVAQTFDWTSVLSGPWAGHIVTGIGIIGMILRAVTTTPLGVAPASSVPDVPK